MTHGHTYFCKLTVSRWHLNDFLATCYKPFPGHLTDLLGLLSFSFVLLQVDDPVVETVQPSRDVILKLVVHYLYILKLDNHNDKKAQKNSGFIFFTSITHFFSYLRQPESVLSEFSNHPLCRMLFMLWANPDHFSQP
jgi:hypothetical protein